MKNTPRPEKSKSETWRHISLNGWATAESYTPALVFSGSEIYVATTYSCFHSPLKTPAATSAKVVGMRQHHDEMLVMPYRRNYSYFAHDTSQSTLFHSYEHVGIKRYGQKCQNGAERVRKDTAVTPRCHAVFWRPYSHHRNTPTKVSYKRLAIIPASFNTSSTTLSLEEVAQTINQPRKRLFRSNHFDGQPLLRCQFDDPVSLSRYFQPHHPVRTSNIS